MSHERKARQYAEWIVALKQLVKDIERIQDERNELDKQPWSPEKDARWLELDAETDALLEYSGFAGDAFDTFHRESQ